MYITVDNSVQAIHTLTRELKISYTSEILVISLHTLVLVYDHSHLRL